jgi:N-acetylglucosamine kinase-like BadF-type ATPase
MDYILGVDGGTTKTIALVARRDGTIIGSGRSGCSNIYNTSSTEAAFEAVEAAVAEALSLGGLRTGAVANACFSMAGADWPEDFALLQEGFARRKLARQFLVVNDAIGALRAGLPTGWGVSVVCGTGSGTGACGPGGRIWHSSFWQEPYGSLDLGRLTLRAVYRAYLQIDPPTSLTGRVLNYFGLPEVEQVLHRVTTRRVKPDPPIEGLARILQDEAEAGDPCAREIVQDSSRVLGDYALVGARRVGIEKMPFTLVLAGGVLRHPSKLLNRLIAARVKETAPQANAIDSPYEPAVGALVLALEAAGVTVGEPLLERLAASMPPAALFAT